MREFSNILKSLLFLVMLTIILTVDPLFDHNNSNISKEGELTFLENKTNQPCLYGTVKEVLDFIKGKIQNIFQITEYIKDEKLDSIRKISEKVLEFYTKSLVKEPKESLALKKAIDELTSDKNWQKEVYEYMSLVEISNDTEKELIIVMLSLHEMILKMKEKDEIDILLKYLKLQIIVISLESKYNDTSICLPSSELENFTDLRELIEEMKFIPSEAKCIDTITGFGNTANKITDDIIASIGDFTINIWSLSKKSLIYTFSQFDPINYPAIRITDDIFATLSQTTIELWSISNRVKISTSFDQKYALSIIKLTDDILAKGGFDYPANHGFIEIWSISSNTLIDRLNEFRSPVLCVAKVTKDIIVGGSRDKTIKIWYLKDKWIGTLIGHTDDVNSVVRINDNIIVSGSSDKTIKVWSLITKSLVDTLVDYCSIKLIERITDDIIATTCDNDTNIKLWSLRSKSILVTLGTGHERSPNSLQRINYNTFISASKDLIKIWSLN